MKTAWFLVALLSAMTVGIIGCNHQRAVVKANGQFAMALYKKIRTTPGMQNMIFSPFSVSTALAMTYGGASGVTKSQMASTLRFSGIPSNCNVHAGFRSLLKLINNANSLNTANRIYIDTSFNLKPSYLTLTNTYYMSPAQVLNIHGNPSGATSTINTWVATHTKQQITNLLQTLDPNTKLVLVNAISFKDKWAKAFEIENNGPFHVSSTTTAQVCKMSMSCGAPSLKYGSIPGVAAEILELPYQGHKVSMYIIRPIAQQGLAGVENTLTLAKLNSAISAMKTRNVNVVLPKFSLSQNINMKPHLQALGMTKVFTYGAQLTGIGTGANNLYVDLVQHKAVIRVDLKGTEASAATAVTICKEPVRGIRSTTVAFDVDRPFVFVLRENSSGSILFMGRVTNPQSSCSGTGEIFDRIRRPISSQFD